MKIKEMPLYERPRERLIKYGSKNISNEDLIAIIIKSGCKENSVKDIALLILKRIQTINNLEDININTFKNIKGLGKVKIIELMASIELGRRIFLEKNINNNEVFNDPKKIYEENYHLFKGLKQEYFYCFYLDNKNKLIERKLLFMGTINRSIVHPREIFKEAYLHSATSIICMHNHPSGDVEPSMEDINFTKSLVEIGRLQGINIIDHIIVSDSHYYSFYNEGKI